VANLNNIKMQALFAMLKGEPGTRKSTCALSFPGRQFWVSTDRKMEAMVLPAKRFGIKLTDIDSITSIGDNMTGQVKRIKKAEGGGKVIGNIPVSGLEEYNAESSAFQELIWLLKDIHAYHNCNIILIAHVVGQRKNDDANKLTHHSRVIITGGDKISGKLASYMTEVYHFNVQAGFAETDEGEYGCFTSHTGNDYARTALPLERYIKFNNQPLYEKWIEPAINRLNAEKPIERIATTNTTTATVPTTQPTTNSFVK
jgi:hypothetical protein